MAMYRSGVKIGLATIRAVRLLIQQDLLRARFACIVAGVGTPLTCIAARHLGAELIRQADEPSLDYALHSLGLGQGDKGWWSAYH